MRLPANLRFLLAAVLLPLCLSQTVISVGDGAPTSTIRDEYLTAYQRGDFFAAVALPPLTEVIAFGSGGYRQDFQDAAKTGLRFSLIRPAVPDLSQGLTNAVRQVRPPIYAVYTQASIGVSTAGFPNRDTTPFTVTGSDIVASGATGSYQTFDKGFGIFVWNSPPLNTSSSTTFTVAEPIYTRWNTVGFDQIGAPLIAATKATSRYSTTATYQTFVNGAIYSITSGTNAGKVFFVRRSVQTLYEANQGPAGFLGYPVGEETVLADGRRRQSFEGGTMEYTLTGTPVLKNAVSSVVVAAEDPVRLTAGQSITLTAVLSTNAGETVTDRDVFWSTSNGRVVSVTGNGNRATIRAVAGGFATITATSEGKVSNRVNVQVASQCCAVGEGAPTQVISQSFADAVQRNRLSLRTPLPTAVRRLGAGYVQEATALPAGNRIWIAKADQSPVAYVVQGATVPAFEGLGSFVGSLGYPTSDLSAGGTQLFQGGALSGSPVRLVSGPILTRWVALGTDAGALGAPVGPAVTSISFTGNQITSQQFRLGLFVQHDSGSLQGRVFVVVGPIAARFQELAGSIGAPITDEFLAATGYRQEFEGATLEYTPGTTLVRVTDKTRRPTLTVTPAIVTPGGRYRVAVGGFAQGASVRLLQTSGAVQDSFSFTTPTGAYVWESVVPANARSGVVVLRAALWNNSETFAEGSYTIRTLAELRPALSKVSGDTQAGAPATVLAAPLRVQLKDSTGNPISGVPLRFESSPGGAIVRASPVTDANGLGEAYFKLPPTAGVALMTAEAGGQLVTFTARASEQLISDFPRMTQTMDGIGRDSFVAALAAVLRFYQQRGVAPSDSGLVDTAALASYLRNICVPAVNAETVCDGFLDAGAGADPIANPLRVLDLAGGSLSIALPEPTQAAVRDAFAANGPLVLALNLQRNGQTVGIHHVVVTGIYGDGDLAIADVNPQFNLTRLGQYIGGFTAQGASWRATIAAAVQLYPSTSGQPAFYAHGNTALQISGPAGGCSRVASWPGVYLQFCNGATTSYQMLLPNAPYLVNLVSLTYPAQRTVASGASATAYRIARTEAEVWTLAPEQLSLNATGILNAASYTSRLAPGAIVSLFGNGLPLTAAGADGLELDGVSLPVFFSNGFQLNTALPVTASIGPGQLVIRSAYGRTTVPVELAAVSPGLFVLDANNAAAALNQDNSVNSVSNPANRGQVIVLFATGLGTVRVGENQLSVTANPVQVVVNGTSLTPQFAGLTPGFVGLYQVNVLIPQELAPGLGIPVRIRVGNIDSNSAIISIR